MRKNRVILILFIFSCFQTSIYAQGKDNVEEFITDWKISKLLSHSNCEFGNTYTECVKNFTGDYNVDLNKIFIVSDVETNLNPTIIFSAEEKNGIVQGSIFFFTPLTKKLYAVDRQYLSKSNDKFEEFLAFLKSALDKTYNKGKAIKFSDLRNLARKVDDQDLLIKSKISTKGIWQTLNIKYISQAYQKIKEEELQQLSKTSY